MKLINCLNETIIRKGSLLEVSDKLKRELIMKFSGQTEDPIETISNYIDSFDNYKSDLPIEKRDITSYDYKKLKSLILGKKQKKVIEKIFKKFKKEQKGIENATLLANIRKFLDIIDILPEKERGIEQMEYLKLVELINKVWNKKITEKLLKKFKKENPNLTDDQILFYISEYIQNYSEFPTDSTPLNLMSFSDFEHMIDAVLAKKQGSEKPKSVVDDIDLVYDQNNLKIFAPKTKDQCIALRNGRSWCTSREGGSNLYYNYRLGHDRTLYYVIDEDKPFNDLNFAVVVLVDPNGNMALADGSNSGKWSGHQNIPWREIAEKIPKLKDLKDILVPKPLTEEEKKLISKLKNIRVGENVMSSFENENEAEMWLEFQSPRLDEKQYASLTPKLKKKYIALGMELTSKNISDSEPEVLSYYISKKIDSIKKKSLNDLSSEDIALLNTSLMKEMKSNLKEKFAQELVSSGKGPKTLQIKGAKGVYAKYIFLYGLDDIFNVLPEDLEGIQIANDDNSNLDIKIPPEIVKFKELKMLFFDNAISDVPDYVCQLPKLRFFATINCPKLKTLPGCLAKSKNLVFINTTGSTNLKLPEEITSVAVDHGGGMWDLNK